MIQPQPEPPHYATSGRSQPEPATNAATGSSHTRLAILLPVAFALRLKEYRTKLFTKQSSLAHAIGCSEAAVSYWEAGRRLPQARTMTRILTVLDHAGVSRAELVELQRTWQGARWASSDAGFNATGRDDDAHTAPLDRGELEGASTCAPLSAPTGKNLGVDA